MRVLALAVALVALPTLAQPSDVPVREIIKAGQPAPQNGCFLNDSACVATGKELAALRAERDALKQSLENSPPAALVIAALALGLVGGAAGAALVLKR